MRGKRKNIVFFLISFILISFLMIANKLYNFSSIIFNFLSFHPDEAWIDLYTNLLLVSLTALITLLLFIITLREDPVEIEKPKIQDKDFMSNLVDEMPDFFVTLNKDGTTRYINETMLIATGFQISEVVQRSFEEIFIIPEQQKMIQNIMLNLHKEDKPTYNDNIILTKDGQELWVRWYSRSVFNDSGEMQYLISIGVDITAQRKSEDELDTKQKIEQLLFKTIPTGIIFRDKLGRIDYLNEWGEELLGVKLEELKGKKFNKLQWTICDLEGNPLTDEKQSFGLVEKSLQPLYGFEQLLKWPDGKIKIISLNVAPIIDDNGVMQGTVASFSDITEQKLEEQERERLILLEKEQSRRIVLENKMIYDLISEEDFSSKLTHVLEIIAQIIPHDGSDITLLDNSKVDVIAIYGYKDSASHDIVKNLRKNLNSYTIEQIVMLNKTPIFIPDTNQESRWVKTPGLEWIRSAMKIPLVFEGKALGTIGFTSEKLNAFNEESLKDIENFVHGLSIVIHNHQNYQQLLKTRNDIISTITKLVEIGDPYTHGHQEEVSKLATAIAQEMGLDKDTIETIRVASLVHDIGKTIIPSEILNKPGKLTALEYDLVKYHSQSGYEILKDISFTSPIAEIVYQHHEKINGSGYPRGLKGNEIMLEARILLVADVYEAMSSHRPYRPALSRAEAEEELEKNKGILYDPEVVDACLKVIRRNPVLSPPVLPD